MDGIAAIQQRIAQIETRIAELAPPRASALAAASSTSAAFGQVLSSVQGTEVSAVGSGSSSVNADNVPYELLGYGNGQIPAAALSTIDGTSHRMWAPAARSFEAMRADAAADGVTIGITDSYRSYDAQVDVAARKGLYSQGGLAAVPGTSNHGWGMALDLRLDDQAQAWMREHADEYGFVEAVPREPWHWEYHPDH